MPKAPRRQQVEEFCYTYTRWLTIVYILIIFVLTFLINKNISMLVRWIDSLGYMGCHRETY